MSFDLTHHFPERYAVIDLETTSVDPSACKIIEVGVYVVDGANTYSDSWLVLPGEYLNEEVVRITGITDEMLEQEGLFPDQAMVKLHNTLGDLVLVGHNALKYDAPALQSAMGVIQKQSDYCLSRFRDTMALYKALVLGRNLASNRPHCDWGRSILDIKAYGVKTNLQYACLEMGIDLDGVVAHRALADVIMTQHLFERLRSVYYGRTIAPRR